LFNPSFFLATFLSVIVGYLAILDPNVRQAFSNLATAAITGYLSLTTPHDQKSTEKDDADTE